jgi:hypothetical protein
LTCPEDQAALDRAGDDHVNGRFAPGLKVRRAVLPSIATGLARNAGAARRPGGEAF